MSEDNNSNALPVPPRARSSSYTLGWNPMLGGLRKFKDDQGQGPVEPAGTMARSGSISSVSDSGSEDASFRESYLSTFARRGSVSIPESLKFQRRPSLDEERILKGEFSF